MKMDKRKICFIAQFPPPMHGLSKAVDTLYNSVLNSEIEPEGKFLFEKIDIKNNKLFLKTLLKSQIARQICSILLSVSQRVAIYGI